MYRYMLLELFFWQIYALLMYLCSILAGGRWRMRMDIASRKLGMHEGKKGDCEQYGFQVSLTVVSYSS